MNTRDTFREMTGIKGVPAFLPRLPILREMNGMEIETESMVDLTDIKNKLAILDYQSIEWLFRINLLDMDQCILSGKVGNKNLGKWLSNAHIPENIIASICSAKRVGKKLTLSTRYKDFARMGNSIHYGSCLSGKAAITILHYLYNPSTFLLLHRDSSGNFKTRILGRLVRITSSIDSKSLNLPFNSWVIIFNYTYGENILIPQNINGIPCFSQGRKYGFPSGGIKKISISDRLIEYNFATSEHQDRQQDRRRYVLKDKKLTGDVHVHDDLLECPVIEVPTLSLEKLFVKQPKIK